MNRPFHPVHDSHRLIQAESFADPLGYEIDDSFGHETNDSPDDPEPSYGLDLSQEIGDYQPAIQLDDADFYA